MIFSENRCPLCANAALRVRIMLWRWPLNGGVRMHLTMDAAGLSARVGSASACREGSLSPSGLGLFAPGARRWP